MIYIGQYKGKTVCHEEQFVATTDWHTDKNYSCPKCGTKWRGTFETCPSCRSESVIVSIVSATEFPKLIKHRKKNIPHYGAKMDEVEDE